MKVFEYMAAKKPMICSKLQVIEEIVTHNHDALLLPASNEKQWAEAIDILAESPDVVETLTENAHKSLRDNYTWDKRVEAIFTFYGRRKSHATRWMASTG